MNNLQADRLRLLASRINKLPDYDQTQVAPSCGSPGCAFYHARLLFKNLRTDGHRFFGVSHDEWWDLFGGAGCGNAGTNAKRAAAYIRAFVKRKLRASKPEAKPSHE